MTEEQGDEDRDEQACPQCGMTRAVLYADGRMGCAGCYAAFEAEVERALQEIHGATRHIGKSRD